MNKYCRFLLVLAILLISFGSVFSLEANLLATVTVNPPPLNLNVNATVLDDVVLTGNNLNFLINLSKDSGDEITVDLLYEVIKKRGRNEEIILSQSDSITLTDSNSSQKTLFVPLDTKPGKYNLRVTATYFNQSDFDEDQFRVKKSRGNNSASLLSDIFTFVFHLFI